MDLMDLGRIVKWIVILGLVYFAWNVAIPWIQNQGSKGSKSSKSSQSSSDNSCVQSAARASETWGDGIGRFVNPPHDTMAWDTFRGKVETRIRAAESECGCATSSCDKARGAMRDLRGLVTDLDSALRSSSGPPSDIVQRQESIDTRIDEARELARSGN